MRSKQQPQLITHYLGFIDTNSQQSGWFFIYFFDRRRRRGTPIINQQQKNQASPTVNDEFDSINKITHYFELIVTPIPNQQECLI
mmetsp:Transcript_20902/g.43781  ORF Transcript_20902/g.43781 Transcript_20902/m.43781 type:complete len:85 (+) Transcript_20902:162-416(+)